MSFQPGLCKIETYLVAAWKDKPSEFSVGHGGINESISFAQFDGQTWQVLGSIPGETSIGVSLASDESDGSYPSVYGAWKGASADIQGYFSPLELSGGPQPIASAEWRTQLPVEGVESISGPSMACLQIPELSAGVYLWTGNAVGQTGPFGEFTVWYIATPIFGGAHLVSVYGDAVAVPNAASANYVQVAVANKQTLYIVWFDNNTKQWTCQLAQLNPDLNIPASLLWGDVITLPNYANAAGYSMTNFDFGPETQNPIYVAWMDESNHIFGSSFDNLAAGGAGTPIPGASGQAATLMGCGLAELGDTLYAVWPDLSGQLCYASSSDAVTWEYQGIIAGATSGADYHPTFPIHHLPPIRAKL